jgi:hypothetical protein
MKQGSILFPMLFNIFINDLLESLKGEPDGVRISDFKLNTIGYADDITVISSTVPGLQNLMDKCLLYSEKLRFKIGVKKTNCIIICKTLLKHQPSWSLGENKM